MIKYQGQGGSIPRETTIAGQRHMLAYINPFEVDLLQQYNAAPNAQGPGGIPAYPGNAAAEGGFGLGVGEAFGGGVSSAGPGSAGSSASPGEGPGASAVGGAFGGFGPDFGGGRDDAAQAGRYGGPTTGTPAASNSAASRAALAASNAAVAQAAADRAAAIAAKNKADLLARDTAAAMAAKSQSQYGIGSLMPGGNVATAVQDVSNQISNFGTLSPSIAQDIADDTGLSLDQVYSIESDVLSMEQMDNALDRSDMSIGFTTDPAVAADLATLSMDQLDPISTTGANIVDQNGNIVSLGLPSTDLSNINAPTVAPTFNPNFADRFAPVASTPAVSTASTTPSIDNATAMTIDEMIDEVMNETPATPTAPAQTTSVTPAQIAQDTTSSSKGTTPSPLGKVGQLFSNAKNDIAMGLIAFGKNRADAADAMFAKGYTAEEVGDFFSRTDATVAANEAAAENAVGARDDVGGQNYLSNPCPDGYFLDPVSKVCVIDTAGAGGDLGLGDTEDAGSPRELAGVNIPTSLPSGSSPFTQVPSGGFARPSALQPYPQGGGLAAMPSPNQAGIIQMAPMAMQPGPQIPNLTAPQPMMAPMAPMGPRAPMRR